MEHTFRNLVRVLVFVFLVALIFLAHHAQAIGENHVFYMPIVTRPDGVWEEVGENSASNGGISNNAYYSFNSKIVIDSEGMPYVFWWDYSSGYFQIYARNWNGETWGEVGEGSASGGGITNRNPGGDPFDEAIPWGLTAAIAPDDTIYVAWSVSDQYGYQIYVLRWNGSNWEEVGEGSSNGLGISNNPGPSWEPSMAIALDGTVYITWMCQFQEEMEIYVRGWNGSAWVEIGDGSATGGGISNDEDNSDFPSIAVAQDGTLYIAWVNFDAVSQADIYVGSWNGSTWVEVGEGSASGGGISHSIGNSTGPFLAVVPDGLVYLSWTNDSDGDREIYVKVWNGSAWAEVGTDSASGGGISNNAKASLGSSLAFTLDGKPYVVWQDESNVFWDIFVRRWDGHDWVEVGKDSANEKGISNTRANSGGASIAFDPDGVPYVTWTDNEYGDHEIYVRRYK